MMIDEYDKNLLMATQEGSLDGIDVAAISNQIDALINEADNILKAFIPVGYDTMHNPVVYQEEKLIESEIEWSKKALNVLRNIFNSDKSHIYNRFFYTIGDHTYGGYMEYRDILTKKKEILATFKNDLLTL